MKPLLFLDVDGVINVLPRSKDAERIPVPGYSPRDLEPGITAYVPRGVRERLRRVLPLYEVIWATAWRGEAHPVFRELCGCPEGESWPYLDWGDLKLPALLRYAGKRRWAWVDDDAGWELERLNWNYRYITGLIMAPDTNVGLTDEHVEHLIEYAQR